MSPLAFIHALAVEYNALGASLCMYSLDDDGEYRGPPDRVWARPADLVEKCETMVRLASPQEMEVGICSEFVSCMGDRCHFVFGDFVNGADKPDQGRLAVVSSPGRWHYYTKATHGDFARLQAGLLLTTGIDVKWVVAGLNNGFNILRLSANNAARFPFAPHFFEPVSP